MIGVGDIVFSFRHKKIGEVKNVYSAITSYASTVAYATVAYDTHVFADPVITLRPATERELAVRWAEQALGVK